MVVREGESIPSYMGLAYRDWDTDTRVAYVIPFNWVARIWREIMFHIRFPHYKDPMQDGLFGTQEKYQRTVRRIHRNQGYNDCIYNMVGRFTAKEMDALYNLSLSPELSEKAQLLLSDVHHNYDWLHHEYKDSLKNKVEGS